jgi:hypothetical protein
MGRRLLSIVGAALLGLALVAPCPPSASDPGWRGLPAWAHGYPVAESNLMRIMSEVS